MLGAMRRPVRLALLCLAWGVLWGSGTAEGRGGEAAPPARPTPPSVTVPEGIPATLDGRLGPGEWHRALDVPLGADTELRLMQRQGTLLVGLESSLAWPVGGKLWLLLVPDAPGAGWTSPGALRIEIEPHEHNRPHLLAFLHDGTRATTRADVSVAGTDTTGGGSRAEVAIPLSLVGVGDEDAGLRFAAYWFRRVGEPPLTWPPGLEARPDAEGRYPDLEDASRWARLSGWVRPKDPGAYEPDAWAAMVEAQNDITRRGNAAHGWGLLVQEEAQLPKTPDIVQESLDAFDWIAEREALTGFDLLVKARILRFLNRKAESLATLDALAAVEGWRDRGQALYERALLLDGADRYDEAAATWERLAAVTEGPQAASYTARAARSRERATRWAAEQEARATDRERTDLPLVLLRTSRGDIVLQLFADDVPAAVAHFLSFVDERDDDGRGFYDGTFFHRVIGNYLVQGGDGDEREDCASAGTGRGPRTVPMEINHRHGFWRGAVGFARALKPLNGSQFFVLTSSRPELSEDGYTAFGQVISGMDVLDRIDQCDRLLEVRRLGGE